jgi:hypothetical protein
MGKVRDRTTGDLLVLMIAGTVCGVVLLVSLSLIVEAWVHPEADTSGASAAIGDVINTLVGLLAGFLAGRTETLVRKEEPGTSD